MTVVPHLIAQLLRADPNPFLGYSDNTNILNWVWHHGVTGFYGGATQGHLGPGPAADAEHLASLTAALRGGAELEITEPGEAEDCRSDRADPRARGPLGRHDTPAPRTRSGRPAARPGVAMPGAARLGGLGHRWGRPAATGRIRRARAYRTLDLGGSGTAGNRPHLGRLPRGAGITRVGRSTTRQ